MYKILRNIVVLDSHAAIWQGNIIICINERQVVLLKVDECRQGIENGIEEIEMETERLRDAWSKRKLCL